MTKGLDRRFEALEIMSEKRPSCCVLLCVSCRTVLVHAHLRQDRVDSDHQVLAYSSI